MQARIGEAAEMKIKAHVRTVHNTYQRFGPRGEGFVVTQMDPQVDGSPREYETITIEVLNIEDAPWALKDHVHEQPEPQPQPKPQPQPVPQVAIIGHLSADGIFRDEGNSSNIPISIMAIET